MPIRDAAALKCARDLCEVLDPQANELLIQLVASLIQRSVCNDELRQELERRGPVSVPTPGEPWPTEKQVEFHHRNGRAG